MRSLGYAFDGSYLFWIGFEPLGGFLLILDSTAFLGSFMAPLLVLNLLGETETTGIDRSLLDRLLLSLP